MPGRPDGTVAAPRSRVAVLTAVAARAALRADGERQQFADENNLRIGHRDVNRALAMRKRPPKEGRPADPEEREWIWESFEVDAAKLGLELLICWIPRPLGPGRRTDHARLLAALRATPGVIAIHDCFDDTVLVQAIATTPHAKRRLQTRLQELAPDSLWSEVRQVDRDQPARGWLEVAREVAASEGRLLEAGEGEVIRD